MSFAAWLVAMVGPLMARLLTALGVQLVYLTGATAAIAAIKSQMVDNLNSLPSAGLQLLGLFGVWHSIGIALGCFTFVMTWKSTKGFIGLAKT